LGLFDLSIDGARTMPLIFSPTTNPMNGFDDHRFVLHRLAYFWMVGDVIPEGWREFCIVRGPHRIVALIPQRALLDWHPIEEMVKARKVGAFAKRPVDTLSTLRALK
jgi:hypothetical protein